MSLEEENIKLVLSSPNGTFLRRVYELSDKSKLKTDNEILKPHKKVIFRRDQLSSSSINYYELFAITSELSTCGLISLLNGDYFGSIVYVSERPVFELYNVLFYSANQNLLKFINDL